MRLWLFHPLIFYPLMLGLAALVIALSLKPQLIPRAPAPVAGIVEDEGSVLLEADAFNSPTDPDEQYVTVVRDFWGHPQSMRIAALPNTGPPKPEETGVEIQLDPQSAALLSDKRLLVEVQYRPLPVNAAPMLAMRTVNAEPGHWARRPISPLSGVVRFDLPATPNLRGLGLRAINTDATLAFGVEIMSIRITPRPARPAAAG